MTESTSFFSTLFWSVDRLGLLARRLFLVAAGARISSTLDELGQWLTKEYAISDVILSLAFFLMCHIGMLNKERPELG